MGERKERKERRRFEDRHDDDRSNGDYYYHKEKRRDEQPLKVKEEIQSHRDDRKAAKRKDKEERSIHEEDREAKRRENKDSKIKEEILSHGDDRKAGKRKDREEKLIDEEDREAKRGERRFNDGGDENNDTSSKYEKPLKVKEEKEDRKAAKRKDREEVLRDEEDRKAKRRERRFSDGVDENKDTIFKDIKVKEEESSVMKQRKLENGVSSARVAVAEPLSVSSVSSSAPHDPISNKVSSITTTNENEGVNITRSDAVTGKFSTVNSGAGKSGNLSLDALAKAKKALQMQKELAEKLKKIPVLNKPSSTSSGMNSQAFSDKDGNKVPPVQAAQPGSSSTVSGAKISPAGAATSQTASVGVLPALTPTNYEAVKRAQELAAKMGFRQDPEFAPLINMFPGPASADTVIQQRPAKVPVLRLDAQGREIDEHGNVVNMTKPTNLSTLKVNINKQKKEAFQILRPEFDVNPESNTHFDPRMGIDKTKLLRPKRMSFQFVEEGRWSKQAEIIKFKNQFGEARAKELKMKQTQLAKVKGDADINPNLIQVSERVKREKEREQIPDIEWWDTPLISSGTYLDAIEKLNMEKLTIYVEHPRPIEPPAEPAPPPPQPLKLTKKEQKKLRTQRRLAKERDRQEMIRQGLLEPPKPKIKMSNLMKVLGSEATQDPTRLEMEIRTAAAEREQAHVDRNISRKLTPSERREKKERKLFDDPNTLETVVSVYKIKSLKHKQTRFKVDVNAHENRLTGCAVITDSMCVVVAEGGKKSIKRYGKLMLRRINWSAAVESEDEGDESSDAPPNQCVLVWQGSVAKPSFNRFTVQEHISDAAARKVFADAGVPHYWDLAANYSEELV